ncbi:MAG: putative glycoside hydrolase [Candidatus Binatia bacterium]
MSEATGGQVRFWLLAGILFALFTTPYRAWAYEGRVVDAVTEKPIEGAVVTSRDTVATTDSNGTFRIDGESDTVHARAVGYMRGDSAVDRLNGSMLDIPLAPFKPKALYLSFYGIGDRHLREQALNLIEDTELNALVIDVKSDNGKIPYLSSVPLAADVGAQNPRTIKDIAGLMTTLREKKIYTIARIVVFKDLLLASARPDLAVKTQGGNIWRDREHLAWTDPFRKEAWDYNIEIAVEAARNGFDEIQFDYVRFPDAREVMYAKPSTERNRIEAISGFLAEARRRLVPHNVFLSADIFGYVCWNLNDTMIGQKLEDLAPIVDYLSPMLYPSSFQFGIPGYRFPVTHPYEIVHLSLDRARQRTQLPPGRFRPWLQAFKDYGFDHRPFTGKEISAQITAAEDFGSDGWMLWNPHNLYSADGLRR